jgi:prepilin signal peptidase PulO-like enzyme (type II secretory pathway)
VSGWWVTPLIGLLFGCAAYLGVQLSAAVCESIAPFEDGPKPGNPPTTLLVGGAVAIGLLLAARGIPLVQLALAAILTVSLVASWYSDVRAGIISDYFTLVPLGVFVLLAVVARDYGSLISSVAVAIPFAIAALVSRGRGMGWGDVKLIALGGAALGIQIAIVAFAGACLIAVVAAFVGKRRSEPIAFAPYLAGAMALALPFTFS